MKKFLLAFYFLIFSFLLTGCLPKKQTSTTGSQTTEGQVEEKKSVFESIRDAMSKSLSLQCTYTVGDVKSVVYIKGKLIKSETEDKGQKYYAIIKDKKLWSWNDKNKQGIVFDFSEIQSKSLPGQKSDEDIINEVEQHKQNCKPTVLSDSMFNPPSDINFQDLSQMFKNFGVTLKP